LKIKNLINWYSRICINN